MRLSIIKTIYFNFHYLPFKQAVKLPIFLRRPHFIKLGGRVVIDVPDKDIHPGMIKLGMRQCSIYPDSGIIFENSGGELIFKGEAIIGNSAAVSIGEKGTFEIGNNFISTAGLKVVCYNKVVFGPWVRLGWEVTVMDTDLHKLTKVKGGFTHGIGSIKLGRGVWCGTKTLLLKNTELPDYVIVAAASKLGKKYDVPSYSIIGNSKDIEVLSTGVYRDAENGNDSLDI